MGKKRILLNDDQQRLAVKGKILGRKRLEEVDTRRDFSLVQVANLFAPDGQGSDLAALRNDTILTPGSQRSFGFDLLADLLNGKLRPF